MHKEIQLQGSYFECMFMQVNDPSEAISLFKMQSPSIHTLATVFRVWRHPLPLHSQIQPQETSSYTLSLLRPPVPAESQEKGLMIWGHNELQMLLGTL